MKREQKYAKKLGLSLGLFVALLHIVWLLAIAITPTGMQKYINWILALHQVNIPVTIKPFDLSSAITLVIFTFAVGYLIGWVFANITIYVNKNC